MLEHFLTSRFISLRKKANEAGIALRTWLLRTDVGRWRKVATEIPAWDERNKLIAALIPAGASVLDLGAGSQSFARYLAPGCHYQPCDVVRSSETVLPCDFNAGWYPDVTRCYDFVVCSGLLEYIRDMKAFLHIVPTYGHVLIASYACRQPFESKLARAKQGWLNHFTQTELQSTFAAAGLDCTEVGEWHGQRIFKLTSEAPPSTQARKRE